MSAEQRSCSHRRSDAGFTLLEMLISLAMVAMLVTILAASLSLGGRALQVRAAQAARVSDLDPVQNAMRELVGGGRFFQGGPATLGFVARLPKSAGDARLQDIVISVQDGRLEMAYRPYLRNRTVETGFATLTLANGTAGVQFSYYRAPETGPKAQGPPGWQPVWTLKDPPPRLIRVRLMLAEGDPRRWPDLVLEAKIDYTPARPSKGSTSG